MSAPSISFSVIIPVSNRPREIVRCVRSVYASRFSPTDYEVLVVDNGSTDETAREAVRAGARTIGLTEANRSEARNAGARVARGRWLAFTDSDCEVDPGWLAALDAAFKELPDSESAPPPGASRIGAIAGRIDSGPPESPIEAYIALRGWLDQEKFLTPARRFSPPFAATANLAIRREAFDEVGGFDPALADAGQDADWCWRAGRAGWSIGWAPEARVVHYHRATLRDALRQAYRYGRGNAALFAKHRGEWGASAWIDPTFIGWTLRGLIATPWHAATGRSPLDRRKGLYDLLTNAAQAAGRLRGAWEHRVPMI
jgi:GT2 family glycosyltransferase